MLAEQVAKKYSAALFHIVREKKLMEKATTEMMALDEFLQQDKDFLQFMLAPHILEQNKEALVKEVFGPRLDQLFLEFLLVLVRKHRIGFLHEIIVEFNELVAEERGVIQTKVITAVPMTNSEKKRLTEKLAAKTGKTIEITAKVDESIIGGMIVILGDQIIDGSIRHALGELREDLEKVKVN